mgnify:CR=1 FL=1
MRRTLLISSRCLLMRKVLLNNSSKVVKTQSANSLTTWVIQAYKNCKSSKSIQQRQIKINSPFPLTILRWYLQGMDQSIAQLCLSKSSFKYKNLPYKVSISDQGTTNNEFLIEKTWKDCSCKAKIATRFKKLKPWTYITSSWVEHKTQSFLKTKKQFWARSSTVKTSSSMDRCHLRALIWQQQPRLGCTPTNKLITWKLIRVISILPMPQRQSERDK